MRPRWRLREEGASNPARGSTGPVRLNAPPSLRIVYYRRAYGVTVAAPRARRKAPRGANRQPAWLTTMRRPVRIRYCGTAGAAPGVADAMTASEERDHDAVNRPR